jgi:hypothetical protein
MYDTNTDFPEYGRQCDLKEPWRGYRRGTIVHYLPQCQISHLKSS